MDDEGRCFVWLVGSPPVFGPQSLDPVVLGELFPLVVAGSRDPELAARRGDVAEFFGQIKQSDASLIDDFSRGGHGDGSL